MRKKSLVFIHCVGWLIKYMGKKSQELKMVKVVVDRSCQNEESVREHPMFGKAVFIECGLHDPKNYCYDHHDAGSTYRLSACAMVHQDAIKRRKFPKTVLLNAVRNFDNLVCIYILTYRSLAATVETQRIVSIADLWDRVGPLTAPSVDQTLLSVLTTAQEIIPFREMQIPEDELAELAIKSVESLRSMVTAPITLAKYETLYRDPSEEFIIVRCEEALKNTLYEEGYRGYAVYCTLADGSFKWMIARASEFVTEFDIPKIEEYLLTLEAGWGGKPGLFTNSPRGDVKRGQPMASTLPIQTVVDGIKMFIKK